MRYEWLIGLRYLKSTRRASVPSLITVISVGGVGVGVATLIVVLAVLGGFEGDLREKILGTKAHLRVTGPAEAPLVSPDAVLAIIDGVPGVVGAAPFVESELLVSSPTNYSGMILRGIDPDRVGRTSELEQDLVAGSLDGLRDPASARRERGALHDPDAPRYGADELRDRIRQLLDETDAMERELERTRAMLDDAVAPENGTRGPVSGAEPSLLERLRALDEGLAEQEAAASSAPGDDASGEPDHGMPALPPPRGETGGPEAEPDHGMPALPPPRGVAGGPEAEPDHGMPALPDRSDGDRTAAQGVIPERLPGREAPGIIIGSQLREVLRVDVGDLVNVVSPDGDLGPAGPVPRSRPFRVVGVFHSGLYEFDNRMAYVRIDVASGFLNLPADEVTGVEVRVAQLGQASQVGRDVRSALVAAGHDSVQVRDWQELNETLFAALALEKVVMFLILSIIILVASFAIVCMLIVIVIEKSREIAVLRSMGASRRGVLGIFLVEGGVIGLSGTAVGLLLGLGVVGYLRLVGFPLEPEVFYIDRLPVEIRTGEVATVALASVVISLLATLYPSVQAARLDPVSGLRYD